MPQESEYRPMLDPIEFQPPLKRWQQCGELIASHLSLGSPLILDIDGVVCRADSLDRPELTTPAIITSVKTLENLGVKVGVATARGEHIVEYLRREHNLQIEGPAILEEGQVLIKDGNKEYLAVPNHPKFIADLRQEFMLDPRFQDSWRMVKMIFESSGAPTFCPGNFQWQGECRASFWFFAHGDKDRDRQILTTIFESKLRKLAQKNELDYEKDLAVSVSRMSVGNLGILSIKGRVDGLPVNKGTAAEKLVQPWVFAADGFGDTALAIVTKKFNGAVIGIEGNLDVSDEPPEFLKNADFVLRNPEELNLALSYAAICLEK